jgi:hypothetical protein
MAIKVTIKGQSGENSINVGVKPSVQVKINPKEIKYAFEINMREALNGDLLIFDHRDIDIVISKDQKKIVAFAKDLMTEVVYGAESRLFEYLRRKGVISYDSIQGGNVYGSMEGKILDSKKHDVFEVSIINIAEWIKEEKPAMEVADAYDDVLDQHLTNPDEDESTPLGKVPQEAEKGSMVDKGLFSPFYYSGFYY